jgi:hypothetical protein
LGGGRLVSDHRTLGRLGPVHEDAVNVGIFLKNDRKIAEFRPRVRSSSCCSTFLSSATLLESPV